MFMLEILELINGCSWFIIRKYPCLVEIYCFTDEILINSLFFRADFG